jgi:hypothetical protein
MRFKTLNFTLLSLAVAFCFTFLPCAVLPLHGSQGTPSSASKSAPAASSPAKKSAVKSSKSASKKKSTTKKTASRSKKKSRKFVRGQRTIESARVLEIQNALAAAGYYEEEPNGQWDDSTTKAMSEYQQDNGFRTTGKPDALSLKKLGL